MRTIVNRFLTAGRHAPAVIRRIVRNCSCAAAPRGAQLLAQEVDECPHAQRHVTPAGIYGMKRCRGRGECRQHADEPACIEIDLASATWFAYGCREGILRLPDLWDRHGVKVKSHVIGEAACRHPALAREIVSRGHEAPPGPPRGPAGGRRERDRVSCDNALCNRLDSADRRRRRDRVTYAVMTKRPAFHPGTRGAERRAGNPALTRPRSRRAVRPSSPRSLPRSRRRRARAPSGRPASLRSRRDR